MLRALDRVETAARYAHDVKVAHDRDDGEAFHKRHAALVGCLEQARQSLESAAALGDVGERHRSRRDFGGMRHRTLPMVVTPLSERECWIRMMTGGIGRDGLILLPQGVVLKNYLRNSIVLFQHAPEHPVARTSDFEINPASELDDGSIDARCTFPPEGVSATADEVCGLVKNGVISAVSVGFEILKTDPVDRRRAVQWELFECSFVSVPGDPGAVVLARAARSPGIARAPAPAATARSAYSGQTMLASRAAYDRWLDDYHRALNGLPPR